VSTGAEVGVVAADLMVVVVVSPGRDGERHDLEYLVNYSDWPVKDWLTKTTVWAATNSRTLTLRGATDDDLRSRRQFRPKSGRVQNDDVLDTGRGDHGS
jgi:hypothetical protein